MKVKELRVGKFIIECLLYAYDQSLLASSGKELQKMMDLKYGSFKRKRMRVNVDKTKVIFTKKLLEIHLFFT